MTRSFMNEPFTPYKDLEREFRSSRRHFKILSLDELRSPDFNLLYDQEYSKEEEEEEMVETMEQHMSKTRTDYGSGVTRPKIDNKDQFEIKGQFLRELQENTFSGSDNEDEKEHIEKVLKIVDLFHVPNITILDSGGAIPTKTTTDAKKAIQEMVEYSQNGTMEHLEEEDPITPKIAYKGRGYRATAPGYYQRNNSNPSFQERRQSMEETLSKFMSESTKRHKEISNLIKEIRASTDAAIRNQGGSIKTLEI
ncbi:hypothetical protein Tco_0697216 [Tanacetum coccineum]